MGISKRKEVSDIKRENVSEAGYTRNTNVLFVKEGSEYYLVTVNGAKVDKEQAHELKFDNGAHDDLLQDLRDSAEDGECD